MRSFGDWKPIQITSGDVLKKNAVNRQLPASCALVPTMFLALSNRGVKMDEMKDIEDMLSEKLLTRARKFGTSNESFWPKEAALEVIAYCESDRILLFGIEAFVEGDDGRLSFIDTLHRLAEGEMSWDSRVELAVREAREFVDFYGERPGALFSMSGGTQGYWADLNQR